MSEVPQLYPDLGFDASSNVLAGQLRGVPVAGTLAHSFVTSFSGSEVPPDPVSTPVPLAAFQRADPQGDPFPRRRGRQPLLSPQAGTTPGPSKPPWAGVSVVLADGCLDCLLVLASRPPPPPHSGSSVLYPSP